MKPDRTRRPRRFYGDPGDIDHTTGHSPRIDYTNRASGQSPVFDDGGPRRPRTLQPLPAVMHRHNDNPEQ